MSIPAAYGAVIIIWSTTPLAIKWSAEGLAPVSGVFLRMIIATCVGYLVLRVMDKKIRWDKDALKYYAVANLGLFVGLLLVYKASTYVASGLISVLFGLSPILSGLLAQYILNDPKFTGRQWSALLLSISGLMIVFSDQFVLPVNWVGGEGIGGDVVGPNVSVGIMLIMTSVFLFSISGVLIKKLALDIDPISAVVGTLITSLPLFAIAWALTEGTMHFSNMTMALPSIIYLGVCGSLLGFACYFYILKKMSATYASIVTLITPVIALCLGNVLNGEVITISIGLGAGFICTGLFLFIWGGTLLGETLIDEDLLDKGVLDKERLE